MADKGNLTDTELLGLISQTAGGLQMQSDHESLAKEDHDSGIETTCRFIECSSNALQENKTVFSDVPEQIRHSNAETGGNLETAILNIKSSPPCSKSQSSTGCLSMSVSNTDLTAPFQTETENNSNNESLLPTVTLSSSLSSKNSITHSKVMSERKGNLLVNKDIKSQTLSTFPRQVVTSADKISLPESGSEQTTDMSPMKLMTLVQEYKTELEATKKKLEKSERKLTKANDYNEVLRKMVEKLSGEIHSMKNLRTCSVHVQVDKDDFLDYITGKNTMPRWNEEGEGISMDTNESSIPTITSPEIHSQHPVSETDSISIADSIKQAAEAVVQQQQADMLQDRGYVYDEHSGLYYHSATGYYYDQHKSLFYDPKTGIYYYYDYDTGQYVFHSQVELTTQNQVLEESGHGKQDLSRKKSSGGKKNRKPPREKGENERHASAVKYNHIEDGVMSQVLLEMEDLKISPYARNARKHALEVAANYPPCVRVMVLESEYVPVGTLYIVTCAGAKIGRENCDICIPDVNISKIHAEIRYNDSSTQYEIWDHASQNGTFLNDQRLSPAKIASETFVLSHDDKVCLSSTRLLCHIHAGYDTCDQCEPGVVIATYRAQQPQTEIKVLSKEEKLRQKKQELNQIKKRYGLKNSAYEDNPEVFNNPNYTDKAEERRKFVGSDVPGQKQEAPASVHRPISTGNIGHKMLQKMGWKEGDSLGKDNKGIQEPISVTLRASQKAGLGSSSAGAFSVDDANTVDMKKANRRLQAQQRFNKIETKSDHTDSNKSWTQGETEFI